MSEDGTQLLYIEAFCKMILTPPVCRVHRALPAAAHPL